MQPSPGVDPARLESFRKRFLWGLLGLEQPLPDVGLVLEDFNRRCTVIQPPEPVCDWQRQLLATWRKHPRALREEPMEAVLELLIQIFQLDHPQHTSLASYFATTLFELARERTSPESVKPVLREAWQQISLAMQRLRAGMGPCSHEGQAVLTRVLGALQPLGEFLRSGQTVHLEEAGWRWSDAMVEWDGLAHLLLTGMQPVTSTLQWGLLLETLPIPPDLRSQAEATLVRWLEDWGFDLAHTLAPYLRNLADAGPQQRSGLGLAVERFGLALLSWQQLLPGWHDEVSEEWQIWLDSQPPNPPYPDAPTGFRWLQPLDWPPPEHFKANLWRDWQRGSREARNRLGSLVGLARLVVLLARPGFQRLHQPFPEERLAEEAGDWLLQRVAQPPPWEALEGMLA